MSVKEGRGKAGHSGYELFLQSMFISMSNQLTESWSTANLMDNCPESVHINCFYWDTAPSHSAEVVYGISDILVTNVSLSRMIICGSSPV